MLYNIAIFLLELAYNKILVMPMNNVMNMLQTYYKLYFYSGVGDTLVCNNINMSL